MHRDITAGEWKPVIEGQRAEKAWLAIRTVADALQDIDGWNEHGGSLSGGAAGLSIFWGYLAKATGNERALNNCWRMQNIAAEFLAAHALGSALYSGFPGVGWASSHLRDLLDPNSEDPAEAIDNAVMQILDKSSWDGSFDLINGLVGHGVYAIERLNGGAGHRILSEVIRHLEQLAIPTNEGLAWFTPAQKLPQWQREAAPLGYWNLGVAHGNPGVLALLGRAIKSDVESSVSQKLLDGGMAWLKGKRNPEGSHGWFGNGLPEGERWKPEGSRVAWCYGDLGIATTMLRLARDTGSTEWESDALLIARSAVSRPKNTIGIQDSCLCHGTAGNALMSMRLSSATGAECYLKSAIDYIDWTLNFWEPGRSFGGFPQHRVGSIHDTPGLLEGSTGVALTLLASLTNTPPNWDRHLLTDLEPVSCGGR